jgi:Caspase domain
VLRAAFTMPIKAALVIGNANYDSFEPLPSCSNDRIEVTRVLNDLGFVVTTKPDCGYGGLNEAIAKFVLAYRQDPRRSEHGGDVVRSKNAF